MKFEPDKNTLKTDLTPYFEKLRMLSDSVTPAVTEIFFLDTVAFYQERDILHAFRIEHGFGVSEKNIRFLDLT
jgi:hypothetical protein